MEVCSSARKYSKGTVDAQTAYHRGFCGAFMRCRSERVSDAQDLHLGGCAGEWLEQIVDRCRPLGGVALFDCAFRIWSANWANLICPSCGRSVSNEHDSRATRRNKTENKTEQLHSLFGQRGGSSRKGLDPLDEIVICVFESGERMIRSMFAAAHASVQRARLTQRRLIIAGLWLGAEF